MKKYKIIIIILCFIIALICIDFIALSFNGSPIIKVRKYYNSGYTIYIIWSIFYYFVMIEMLYLISNFWMII